MDLTKVYYVLKGDLEEYLTEIHPEQSYEVEYHFCYGFSTDFLDDERPPDQPSLDEYLSRLQSEFSTLIVVNDGSNVSQTIRDHISKVVNMNLSNLQNWYEGNSILETLANILKGLLLDNSKRNTFDFSGFKCSPKILEYDKRLSHRDDSEFVNVTLTEYPLNINIPLDSSSLIGSNKPRQIPANHYALIIFFLHKLEDEDFNITSHKEYIVALNLSLIQKSKDGLNTIIDLNYIHDRYYPKRLTRDKDVVQFIDRTKLFGTIGNKTDRTKNSIKDYFKEHKQSDKLSELIEFAFKTPYDFFLV